MENSSNISIDLLEIISSEFYSEALLLKIIQNIDPTFSYNCIEAEILAAHYFLTILNDYLTGKIKPSDLCRIFSNIEIGFLDAPRNLSIDVLYYPEWIGSLYDACDWCDETWTIENMPHLLTAAKQQISLIRKWLSNFN
ncbi:hypothetical protein [Alkanindiges illinoisensis]|uniref:hypothetical protein n=1 Tax=Alkanindiges illinoisensis TaxID=197183 RepID=UPI001D17BD32|nr:hypothetical protein [Alkanindiges illinoisensis]